MRKNKLLIGTTVAVLLAPMMITNSILDVHADSAKIGIVRRNGGTLVDGNGKVIANRSLGNFTSWQLGTMKTINGVNYYKVATNEWINANSVEIKQANNTGYSVDSNSGKIGTVKRGMGTLVNDNGNIIANRTLGNFTSWKLGATKVMNGKHYYRVATNEWISADSIEIKSANETPSYMKGIQKTPGYKAVIRQGGAVVFNDFGSETQYSFGHGTAWKVDAMKYNGGLPYYRIATGEWIAGQNADIYNAAGTLINGTAQNNNGITATPGYIGTIFHAGSMSYTDNGQITPNAFGHFTSWKLNGKKTMNGQTYYRVAPNQWISEDSMAVTDANGHTVNQQDVDRENNNATNWGGTFQAQTTALRDFYDNSTNTYVKNPFGAGSNFTIYKAVKNNQGKYFFEVDKNRWLPADAFSITHNTVFENADYEPYFATSVK
ncbi:SLAP domain-containing protein [Companilactobacillus hulinensis]|uniref:SLAP domain-containing protein n=1 Tax=Companilactobacillus hulinensis TaxID=2486007 RepID=UPI000F7A4AD2|nr:SLAP domain-containing protein [Companilactobacillus hulinensis]